MAAISEYLERRLVFPEFPPGERDEVLRAVVDRCVAVGALAEDRATTVLRSILKRERVGSTGIGRGIAIPHAKTSAVDRPLVAFARLAEPVDFGATDAAPVHSVFVIVSPPESNDEHMGILKWVAKIARSDYYSTILRNTRNADSLYELFLEIDGTG